MLKCCLLGAGRIGQVHGANVVAHPGAHLEWVIDAQPAVAERTAEAMGAKASTNPGDAIGDPDVDAVIICSPTPTHVDLIRASARAGKAIFCEKPIDLHLGRVEEAMSEVEAAQVPFFIGFNRRFDRSFQRLKTELANGVVGRLEMVHIISRDPAPPPMEYLRQSGGLFRDMMIHDLDMARWVLGDEPVKVYATGSALIDPSIGQMGDVDTALVTLETKEGVLCQISNSRRAAYGYDQRIEVLGSKGMLRAENVQSHTVGRWTAEGVHQDNPPHFFIERYMDAYRAELQHFIRAIQDPSQPLLTGPHDGRQALVLANACIQSLELGRPVQLS
ncbi:MAG: inositol 2-dehydrogenase [Myxococcota bacterium]